MQTSVCCKHILFCFHIVFYIVSDIKVVKIMFKMCKHLWELSIILGFLSGHWQDFVRINYSGTGFPCVHDISVNSSRFGLLLFDILVDLQHYNKKRES